MLKRVLFIEMKGCASLKHKKTVKCTFRTDLKKEKKVKLYPSRK
jgi:hypothetical protein